MITQEELSNNLRTIIESCVGRLAIQILQTIKTNGTFSDAVSNTQKSVNDLGINILQLICQEVDNAFDLQRDRHKVIIKHRCKKRSLLTSMGEITLERKLYLDKAQKRFFFAVDELLSLEKNSRIEQNMKVELIRNATLTSYGKASELVEHKVSRQTVHNLVRNVNTADLSTALLSHPKKNLPEIFIEADEDHIHLQNGKCAEVRLVYVHEGVKSVCKGRTQLENVRYFISAEEDPDEIWNNVAHYLYQTYSMHNAKVHISGDGAYWIKFGKQILPKAEYHIDKFHIQKSATAVARGNVGIKNQILRAMRNKDKEKLRVMYYNQSKELKEHSERRNIAKNYFYLENNIESYSMQNRCSAEGHVSHVLSARMSSRPMAWSLSGAERIAQLRAYYFNNGDFSQLVAGDELNMQNSNNCIKTQRKEYNCVVNSSSANYYTQARVVGIDGITDRISRKLRKILDF